MTGFLEKSKKITVCIAIIIIALSLLLLLITVATPFILLANEGMVLKADLDNPVIDSNYDGWSSIEINSLGSCLFPKEWNVSEEAGIIYITDTTGTTIGVGTVLQSDNSAFQTQEAFLTEILGFEVTGVLQERSLEFVPIDSSFFGTISITGEKENTYGAFSMEKYGEAKLFVLFPTYTQTDAQALIEKTQAISFSYSFPEACGGR